MRKNYRIFSKYYTNSLLVISYMTAYLILKVIQSNNEQKPRDEKPIGIYVSVSNTDDMTVCKKY